MSLADPPRDSLDVANDAEYSLKDSIAYQLRNTYRCFAQALEPMLARHEVTIGMWYYLRVLWEEDGLTQRQISERVGLVAPTTVEQLKNMERRGLLERRRSTQDRRKIHVHLTEEGWRLRDRILPYAPRMNTVAMQGVSAAEAAVLRKVLGRLQQNLIAHGAGSGVSFDDVD